MHGFDSEEIDPAYAHTHPKKCVNPVGPKSIQTPLTGTISHFDWTSTSDFITELHHNFHPESEGENYIYRVQLLTDE